MTFPEENSDEAIIFTNEAYATALKLEFDLFDKVSTFNDMSSNFSHSVINIPPPVVTQVTNLALLSNWLLNLMETHKMFLP